MIKVLYLKYFFLFVRFLLFIFYNKFYIIYDMVFKMKKIKVLVEIFFEIYKGINLYMNKIYYC